MDKIIKSYTTKYNIVKSECEKTKADNKNLIPNYANFTCYLESIGENDFMKYNLYEMSLLYAAQITPEELMKNDKLLEYIQKSFRKKLKGKMSMRHFSI